MQTMTKSQTALSHYHDFLGLPPALLSAVSPIYKSQNARIFLLDNSNRMKATDSTLMEASENFTKIDKKDGVSRWAELSQCVEFHTKMAARCGMPTQFRLVNTELPLADAAASVPSKFAICWNESKDKDVINDELDAVLSNMESVKLNKRCNPMARELRKIFSYLQGEAETLRKKKEFVSVIICTHGVPTDEEGKTGTDVTKDFIDSILLLSNLPVKIIFRLCTDNDDVINFFSALDAKFDLGCCDVLDDFWGEALEVYLHNPWLTYGIGIHRIREAGLGTELMDLLDEKSFTIEEIRDFCVELFIGPKNELSLRNPNLDFKGFIDDLEAATKKESLVWNPMKKKLTPWIDVQKIKLMFEKSMNEKNSDRKAYVKSASQDDSGDTRVRSNVRRAERSRGFAKSKTMHAEVVPENKRSATNDSRSRERSRGRGLPKSKTMPAEVPENKRSATNDSRSRKVSNMDEDNGSKAKDLKEYMQQWSHEAPDYKQLKPLQVLLVNVPDLFPPKNKFVESHEYYLNWKVFSDLSGESGDELKELLRRASRKSKLFLHPDKLPNDLTKNQDEMFKTIWNVMLESEAATFQ